MAAIALISSMGIISDVETSTGDLPGHQSLLPAVPEYGCLLLPSSAQSSLIFLATILDNLGGTLEREDAM